MRSRWVVTGAHGFVGRALCAALALRGERVAGIVRRAEPLACGTPIWVYDGPDFAGIDSAWPRLGPAPDCVVHLAARVHMMHDAAADSLAAYRAANVDGVMRVAVGAHAAGAKRFILVSSIKALGDADRGTPLREDDAPLDLDPYGVSKREAEAALFAYGEAHGMEIVVVRPPLVYGPSVRANFLRLLRLVATGLPLPLGAVKARRSLVGLDNLVDALILCGTHPAAAGRIYHVTDGVDLSTAELIQMLGCLMARPVRLLPVPPAWLRLLGRLSGRSQEIDRLITPLRVDSTRIRAELGWQPPRSVEQGLAQTVEWFRTIRQ